MSNLLGSILGTLFGVAEFGDWPWRIHAQAGVVVVALLASKRDGPRRRLAGFAAALVLGAITGRSPGWGLLAVAAAAVAWGGYEALGWFVIAAAATLGAGAVYLHSAVLWDVDLGKLVASLAHAVLPQATLLGEWLVIRGAKVHLAHLSPLVAIPVLAAVLSQRDVRGWRLAGYGALGMVLAAVVKVGAVLLWSDLNQPAWALGLPATGLYMVAVGGLFAFLVPPAVQPTGRPAAHLQHVTAAAAGVLAFLAFGPETGPQPKALEIVIDDAHGEWETTQRPYDTTRYGRDTVYTYSLLRQWLSNRYAVEAQTTAPLHPRGDVLLVKTPAEAYGDAERAAVVAYLRAGGGLLVLGDHTNLFGTTDHANNLLTAAGLRLRSDAVLPLEGLTRKLQAQWWNASPLLPLGAAWESQTSASIMARPGSGRPLLVDTAVVGEAAEFSNDRNFAELRVSLDDRPPPLVVAAQASLGEGRVVVLADSTPWSNFSFFAPGNKELLDAAVRLAARSGAARSQRWRWFWAGLALLALLAALHQRPTMESLASSFIWYGVVAALACPREPLRPAPFRDGARERSVLVDARLGVPNWDTDIRVGKPTDRDVFAAFLAWMSRVQLSPEVVQSGAYRDATRPVVVLNPSLPPSPAHVAAAEAFVREGGRILLLDDPARRPQSTGQAFLKTFGVRYRVEVTETGLHEAAGPQLPDLVWALPLTLLQETRRQPGPTLAPRTGLDVALEGVEPVWVDDHGLVVYGRRAVGKGSVNVFIRSTVFSQAVMGDIWGGIEPGPEKDAIYRLEYALLQDLVPERAPRLLDEDLLLP